ncbi:helix-turn-helix domain-containing protein [Stutzerimonas stutzeri]|uniref:helix-turn-helix domain-containing protein n=1 Tax=Stutzerimonas stutzeri TaxID=316 RepID=UPI0015E45352|nr:AraC family transcriptional regulator [Stutzerimonas stutzeri]MBA1265809.1 helix-turn-helix transcriptional regulator [Stutzerimonas stutzeri]
MQKPIAPKDLIKWLPGEVLSTSEDRGWKDIEQRSYRYMKQDVLLPPIDHFMIVSYSTGHTPMDRRTDDKWKRAYCTPGDISLLTNSQPSHWHWTEEIDVSHIYISNALMSRVAMDVLERTIEDVRLYDLLHTQDEVLTSIVNAITKETTNRATGCSLYVDSLSIQLAIHLLRHYANVTLREREAPGCLSLLQKQRLLEYIDAHLQGTLRVDDMADAVGLGAWSFSRKFSESFNCSPHTFITEQRIERAKRMLHDEKFAIKEIAYLCGFSDQAHLTRVLRTKLGITPGQLRRTENRIRTLLPSGKA